MRHRRAGLLAFVTSFAIAMASTAAFALSTGPQPAATGAPAIGSEAAEGTCIQCHTTAPLNPDGAGTLTIEGVPAKYEPGHSYTLTVKLSHTETSVLRWGFQLTAIVMKDGSGAGEFVVIDPSKTQIVSAMSGSRSYIEHSYGGTAIGQTGSASWTFEWKAPASDVGKIGFFAAGNAANADGSNQGDRIYTKSPAPLAETNP